MAKREPKSLFRRLTRLFRSGPVVKRKIRGLDTTMAVADKTKSSGTLLFQKSLSPTYATITSNAYNLSERLMRYQDFQEMEYTPEIAAALDIYADETVAADEKGRCLHVYSDNEKIKETLEDLFYNSLNVEFNLRSWARNLCKYGDFFLYADVSPSYGVINAFPIPVNEIEREENFDRDDPFAIRYRWVTLGNRTLENWEVVHFRLLGNDMFLPYGSSVIEPARRIWRQLILLEDAMLVYRVVRAPERRVFYIDVANVPPENVPQYVEEQRAQMRTSPVIDRATGRVDLRFNPLSVDEDYFIPVRGGESGTKIDTLAGLANQGNVEDVAYLQKKLFAALKIPRAYLGYDEMLSSKATLAQEDIRFSRTVNVIQKTMLAELNKLAIIHLYAHGFDGEDLQNFTLRLSNPSTVAQQQKLELWRAKFEIAGTAPERLVNRDFLRREILGMNDEQMDAINDGLRADVQIDTELEASAGGEGGGGGEDLFGGGGGMGGGGGGGEAGGEEAGGGGGGTPPEENASDEPEEETEPDVELLTSMDHDDEDDDFSRKVNEKDGPNVKVSQLAKTKYNRGRRRTHGASKTHMPDFVKMTSTDNHSMEDPFDNDWIKSVVTNPLAETVPAKKVGLSRDVKSSLSRMSSSTKFMDHVAKKQGVIAEGEDVQDQVDSGAGLLDESVQADDPTSELLITDEEGEE